MRNLKIMLLLALLASCATTNELPLSANRVRLDTQASGLLFTSSAGAITLKKAAEATIRRGYTHFRIEQADTSQGSRITGFQSRTSGSLSGGYYSGSTIYTPMATPTASVGITVVMFRAGEPGAGGAFDAAEVLKKQGRL